MAAVYVLLCLLLTCQLCFSSSQFPTNSGKSRSSIIQSVASSSLPFASLVSTAWGTKQNKWLVPFQGSPPIWVNREGDGLRLFAVVVSGILPRNADVTCHRPLVLCQIRKQKLVSFNVGLGRPHLLLLSDVPRVARCESCESSTHTFRGFCNRPLKRNCPVLEIQARLAFSFPPVVNNKKIVVHVIDFKGREFFFADAVAWISAK